MATDVVTPHDSQSGKTRRYAKVSEAAKHIRCSERTILQMIADGRLSGYRSGKRLVRVDLDELDAVIQPSSDAIAAHIEKIIENSPPLSPAQRDRIATILRGGAA